MTKEEFISNYPTPGYVTYAWVAMHANLNVVTMGNWEEACEDAMREATEAYERRSVE